MKGKYKLPTILLLFSCISCGTSADTYLEEGRGAADKGNYQSAITLLDKAIEKKPALKEAYLLKGFCYVDLGQADKAIISYQKLLSIDPKNTSAFYYIGMCKYDQDKFKEAIEYYNKAAITKNAFSSDSIVPRGGIDLVKNGLVGEQPDFDIPSYEICYQRGLAFYKAEQIKNAYDDFAYCVEEGYQLGESYYMEGLCWLWANKKDKACKAFQMGVVYGDSLSMEQVSRTCR